MRYHYLLIFFTVCFLASCKLFNPEELTPSYIYISDIKLETKTLEGSSSDNILDAWVYVNGSYIGTWELPAKIPIHVIGEYDLEIFGGIKKSGLSAFRVTNDFMTSFDSTLISISNVVDTIIPTLEYVADLNIWLEEFEDPGVKFTGQPFSDTVIRITNDPLLVFEGNGTGVISFSNSDLYFLAKTNEPDFNTFPKQGAPIYYEFDYKSDEVLTVGIYHNNISTTPIKTEFFNLFPTDGKWKKIYLDLKEIVSPQTFATEFDIYLEVSKNRSSQPLVYIDNIKVIYK
ncbi:MAG: hypothetical protein P8N07_00065 [Flavobacteriales bacterium]|nr:hypothetical protein [Flavobacteriales bacterium]MDG1174166.1 hypothetical protein [Flavobacteriales bacterium]